MADIQAWYNGIPPFTKTWFSLSVGTTVLGRLVPSMLPFQSVALTPAALTKLQVWRFVTATFYYPAFGGLVMHYLSLLYFMYQVRASDLLRCFSHTRFLALFATVQPEAGSALRRSSC